MTLKKTPFGNIVGKGENAGNQHFLHFPQFFFYLFMHKYNDLIKKKSHLLSVN